MVDVAVVVPVYKVEKYLAKCLDSIINQTYKNLKIIVVNDGSPDGCQKIIDRYHSDYPDKIVPLIKPNGGLGDARNYGLMQVDTEFVVFIDSDDYIHPQYVEKMIKKAKENNADMVFCGHYREFEDGSLENVPMEGTAHSVTESPELFFMTHAAWNKLCKTDIFKKNNIAYPVGLWYEDLLPGLMLLKNAKHIEFINEPLYYYLVRDGSISNTFNSKIFDYYKVMEMVNKEFGNSYCSEIEFIAFREILINLPRLLMRYKCSMAEIEKCLKYINGNYPKWFENKYIKTELSLENQLRLFTMRYRLYPITYIAVMAKYRLIGAKKAAL